MNLIMLKICDLKTLLMMHCRCGGDCVCDMRVKGSLTVCVHSNDEVISHGLGLPQLVGVAIMDHVIAGRKKDKK